MVADAQADPRFVNNPHVKGKPHVRFFAGEPISAPDGSVIGALCVIDHKPRVPSEEDLRVLRDLAQLAQREITPEPSDTTFKIQKQAAELLRLSEARFREVVDIPGKFVWETELNARNPLCVRSRWRKFSKSPSTR